MSSLASAFRSNAAVLRRRAIEVAELMPLTARMLSTCMAPSRLAARLLSRYLLKYLFGKSREEFRPGTRKLARPKPCQFCNAGALRCDDLAESFLGDADQGGETGSVMHGDIGQHLTVQLNLSQFQAVDQLRVAHAVQLGGCANANDP